MPNVYPEGGDPWNDLLSWYEKQTNTLILRTVFPLREKTRYAVVLTERLVGADGEPVRSPWGQVHHMRQTAALEPVIDALAPHGVTLDDIAFAWTYTTGNPTDDLRAARKGLLGQGVFADMDRQYPEGITVAQALHELPGKDPAILPLEDLVGPLSSLGLIGDTEGEVLFSNYLAFSDGVVGGQFTTPNLFGQPGQAQAPWPEVDDSDDWWQTDSHTGAWSARPEAVTFSCVRPKGVPQPAPVVVFGHGYGSSRFEFMFFAWGVNRLGMAACSFDYPSHGLEASADELALAQAFLTSAGLLPLYDHLMSARHRDLDNDGAYNSGGDQWSADGFHTRDMVRQGALDHAQFIDSLLACGDGTMVMPDGSEHMSCDWDDDGVPDIGGPDAKLYQMGGSLGGINTAVTAPVVDEVIAWAPIVPGGGLDVAFRSDNSGAVEAMYGVLLTPLIVGLPQEDGSIVLTQVVSSVNSMVRLPIATVGALPPRGRIIVENLVNGQVREGFIPEDGRFRVSIAADALSAWEKANLAGRPLDGTAPDGAVYPIDDPELAGDALRITIETEDGEEVQVIETWESDVVIEGVTYPAGSTLVAASEGLGHVRASPEAWRPGFALAQIVEPGDPIQYARAWNTEPFPEFNGAPRRVLNMPTPGDPVVAINAGISLSRAAGWLPQDEVDDRYGMTIDQWLIDREVVRGLADVGPWTCADGNPCLFDVDDADQGLDGQEAPSDEPLLLNVPLDDGEGVSAFRMPYSNPRGSHGFGAPNPDRAFDIASYGVFQVGSYFLFDGTEISDDLCLEDQSCEWIPPLPEDDDGG